WPMPINPLGPLLAAPLLLWMFDGSAAVRDWWRRILRFRAPLRIYAIALFLPLAIIVASVLLARAVGTPAGPLPGYTAGEWLIGIPLVALFGPAPEEPGFRGLGQHELQQVISPFVAALWIGAGVTIWHIPLFFIDNLPPIIALTLLAVSVVYAWLFISGGSVWPLVTLHFVQNYFGGQYFGRMFAPEDSQVWLGFLTLFYLIWAAFLLWRSGPALGLRGAADRR
ncbi:MAG TPA: CPBP family intramembrane glutamic endopeptidase, partial [Paracoccaceae bacterium]